VLAVKGVLFCFVVWPFDVSPHNQPYLIRSEMLLKSLGARNNNFILVAIYSIHDD